MYIKETKGPWKPFTIANFVTYSGFIFLSMAIWHAIRLEKNLTFFYFLLAGLTDYFDGKISRFTEEFIRNPKRIFYGEPENFADMVLRKVDLFIETLREDAKKIPWFFGISRLGEILDPLRDKLLLIPAIITEPYLIGIVLVEAVSTVAAIVVRDMKGFHFITRTSKRATFVQLPMVMILFLTQTPEQSYIVAGAIYLCSLSRCFSYCNEIEKMSGMKKMEIVEEQSTEEELKAA